MNLIKYLGCLVWLVLQGLAQTAAGPASYSKQATISQTADKVHIEANSARPLEQTLDALQKKYGWVVNYEDPQYTSHLDFAETPGDPEHTQRPTGGSFSVEFPATAPDEEKTLRLVLDAYNHSKNPGQFELRHSAGGTFYVVGTAAHDEKGAITPQQPLFDLPVTLPTEERTIGVTVNLICQAITQQTHTPVTLGVNPRSILDGNAVKIGGTKVPARDLLSQSLQVGHRTLYWRLLFDPGTKGYFLDIHRVRPS